MLIRRCFRLNYRQITSIRFNSTNKEILKNGNDADKKVSEFNIKSETSKAAPAPFNTPGIEKLLKKDNKPYIPKLNHKRLSFEYPSLPNQDQYNNLVEKPRTRTRWSRYIPKILTVIVLGYSVYMIKIWFIDPATKEEGEDSNDLLSPIEFHKFIITHKLQIDNNHYLIELKPKYSNWMLSFNVNPQEKSLWSGQKLWSVEVKHPMINIVRSYTPLPLYFMKSEYTRSGEKEPLLKVINPEIDVNDREGTMVLYVKRYDDGEVSKYITNKEIGDELELRGPDIDYKFPYHPLNKLHSRPIFKDLPSKVEPDNLKSIVMKEHNLSDVDNLTFYCGGTGISPALQMLFSKEPSLGYTTIHYSARSKGELGPLERFLFFLEKLDRIKLVYHIDNSNPITKKDITKPEESNYITPKKIDSKDLNNDEKLKLRMAMMNQDEKTVVEKRLVSNELERGERFESVLEQAQHTSKQKKKGSSLAIVCGPDGYVDYIAGSKDLINNQQGEVKGLLGGKKWDNSNVYKL
ncbi:unnamed protein product [Candida verbasci]|uniref:Flavoprotein pyridine nucleotide cytochrome reductase-like FAD-binding domain-containing protein n=1 Tax=Candida verbasci TaxID=1227364 RepID=A0A9W4XBU4_9ASCO|nr:unnamed protein product [Candida verbasci]